ncbi:MAG: site-specific integrase [Mesorhizobium sp.]|nr:MAG: site-specific integrase [Mesorhizobium sp.]
MPRKAAPPRLYLRPDDRTWIIRDKGHSERTGCAECERDSAEVRLAEYLAKKHIARPAVGGRSSSVSLAEVMRVYVMEHAPSVSRPQLIADHIKGLAPFWGTRMVSSIKGKTCREFAASRTTQSVARHELETLRAAVNYFHKEYGLDPLPAFTMPEKHRSRERWLTRTEAASLLRSARGLPHLRRFILIALYTGTRSGAVLRLSWLASISTGYIDLERGVLHRSGSGQRQTNKRQPPVKLSDRLAAHLRRWKRMDGNIRHVINWNGQSVQSVKKSFRTARTAAKLDAEVIPHTLRHTCASWLMQAGVEPWDAAGFLGMTVDMLVRTYGHHSEKFQEHAARAVSVQRPAITVRNRTESEQNAG